METQPLQLPAATKLLQKGWFAQTKQDLVLINKLDIRKKIWGEPCQSDLQDVLPTKRILLSRREKLDIISSRMKTNNVDDRLEYISVQTRLEFEIIRNKVLFEYMKENDVSSVKKLLDSGADPNAMTMDNYRAVNYRIANRKSAYMVAVMKFGQGSEMAQLIKQYGGKTNPVCATQMLQYAVGGLGLSSTLKDQEEAIKQISNTIFLGADPNHKTTHEFYMEFYSTHHHILPLAISSLNAVCVEAVLKIEGLRVNDKETEGTYSGKTALDMALDKNFKLMFWPNLERYSPLIESREEKRQEIIQLLKAHGAKTSAELDAENKTA